MYNMFVARKKSCDKEYWAFVFEGEGIHVHKVKCVNARENSKEAYLEAYQWAANYVKSFFGYQDVQVKDTVFYVTTDTMRRWFEHFVNLSKDGIAPPPQYYGLVENVYNTLEEMGCRYCVKCAAFNRATMYATKVNYENVAKNNKRETVADAFGDLLKDS